MRPDTARPAGLAAPAPSRPGPRPVAARIAAPGVEIALTETAAAPLLDDLAARMAGGTGFAVATLNLDHLVKLMRDPAFRAAYAAHTHVTADGRPITWLARLAGRRIGLVTGSDLVVPLLARAAAGGTAVALVGATEETLALAAARLEAAVPGLRVAARIAPPFGLDPEGGEAGAALDRAAASGAGLVLLALGAPRQERLAARGLARHPALGFVSVGAGIDFLAGTQRRAPRLLRRCGLEWAWRLAADPRRLAGRYLACALILPRAALATRAARRAGDAATGAYPP